MQEFDLLITSTAVAFLIAVNAFALFEAIRQRNRLSTRARE